MKRFLVLGACVVCFSFGTQAQVGGLLQKAAKQTMQKTTDKLIDKVSDKASEKATEAIEKEFGGKTTDNNANAASSTEPQTYSSLMGSIPEIPTAQQFVNYKEAEFNEQSLKMLASPVTSFNAKVLSLSMQVFSLVLNDVDSAQVVDAAYKLAQMETGLTKEQINELASLPEEEQEAYIAAHYNPSVAEAAAVEQAQDAAKYLEPLQPLIDKWDVAGNKADACFTSAKESAKVVYQKYADKLEKATGKERNSLLLKYYGEIVNYYRDAVRQSQQIRLKEQLPIAEEIEKEMVKIRAQHQDIISAFLNYPQLTASAYFADVACLLDIPTSF